MAKIPDSAWGFNVKIKMPTGLFYMTPLRGYGLTMVILLIWMP